MNSFLRQFLIAVGFAVAAVVAQALVEFDAAVIDDWRAYAVGVGVRVLQVVGATTLAELAKRKTGA